MRCIDCHGVFPGKEVKKDDLIIEQTIPGIREEIKTKEPELPSVLILLPTKNHGQYLEKHLKNYKDLDYPRNRIRMVVVYAPSSDNTLDLLMDFAKNADFKVELYQEPKFKNLRGRSSHWIGDLCNGLKEFVEDEEFTLFIDDDIIDFPSDLLKTLTEANKDVVSPYVYLDKTYKEFWDTMVFKDIKGVNFTRTNPPSKNSEIPIEVSSAGCCLMYKSDIFVKVPFGNPAPHMTWCASARRMGYHIWALPYSKIIHADVRKEREPWDIKYSGRLFVEKARKEQVEKREIIKDELLCSFCGHALEMDKDNKTGWCPDCRQTLKEENIQERKIEQITTEWILEPIKTYAPIVKESFTLLYPSSSSFSISIFGFTGMGYGGLASVPFYFQNGLNELKIPSTIFSLTYDETEESIQKKLDSSSDYIFYFHYDKLANTVPTLLKEAKKRGKKVIVFPTDSWMDVYPHIRKMIYKEAWRIVAYADWIKNDSWDGECRSYGVDPGKIIVQRFGVRKGVSLTDEEKKLFRKELGVTTKYLIGEMGFVRAGKGLIYPMLDVISKIKDSTLLILGTVDPTNTQQSPYLKELTTAIGEKNLEERIIWMNRTVDENEISRYLGCCDILALPSSLPTDTSGSLNLSIGINGGKCVVTTPQRTRREISEKYKAIATSDPSSFPDVIKKILNTKDYLEIEKNAKKYTDQFSWKEFGKEVVKIFQKGVKSPKIERDLPKVLVVTAIKFDTTWQRDSFKKNLKEFKNLDYPRDKLKIAYLCYSEREVEFIKAQMTDYNIVTIVDPEEWRKKLGKYKPFAVHFYADIFNNVKKEITDEEFVLLLDADYVRFPSSILKDLVNLNVDIVSPYLYRDAVYEFFDTYGFGRFTSDHIYAPGYYQQFEPRPPWEDHEGIVQLAYAGTGFQLTRASIFKEIEWVNPDSWLHWCQMARERGFVVYGAPQLKAYHGSYYEKAGKESRNIFTLVQTKVLSIDECIERGLTTMVDWHRLWQIKYTYTQKYFGDRIYSMTIQKWIDEGKCELKTIEDVSTLVEKKGGK